jgi:hypothetical protein
MGDTQFVQIRNKPNCVLKPKLMMELKAIGRTWPLGKATAGEFINTRGDASRRRRY